MGKSTNMLASSCTLLPIQADLIARIRVAVHRQSGLFLSKERDASLTAILLKRDGSQGRCDINMELKAASYDDLVSPFSVFTLIETS